VRKNWTTEGGRKQRRRGRNREVKIKTGRQSEERKERIQKKPRRGSSVGTALPHCHLRLQLQGRGTVEPLSEPEEPEEKQTKKGKYRSKTCCCLSLASR
jgi:hypothetical protein